MKPDPPELNPPGLNGATGDTAALLKAAIRSRNEPPLGLSETGGGADGFDDGGAGLEAAGGGGEGSAGLDIVGDAV